MLVQVCIGSACHLKGSYEIINYFKNEIKNKNLDSKITLKASFCLGKCSNAVSVRIDDDDVSSVSPENMKNFFECEIEGRL